MNITTTTINTTTTTTATITTTTITAMRTHNSKNRITAAVTRTKDDKIIKF